MKPSEEIQKISKELSDNDWVAWGGNSIMKDVWDGDVDKQNMYYVKAIIKYLDRKAENDILSHK